MAFFYSSNGVVLPIFVRQVFGVDNFITNVGFLWLSYPVGAVLITSLFKALFETFHFTGFPISIAICHLLALYNAYSMRSAHKKDLLKQLSTTAFDVDVKTEPVVEHDLKDRTPKPCISSSASADTRRSGVEQQRAVYAALRAVLAV